jgi:hypothetical protein
LQGHLLLEPKSLKKARNAYETAKKLIEYMNYGLRSAQLSLLASRLAHYNKGTNESEKQTTNGTFVVL